VVVRASGTRPNGGRLFLFCSFVVVVVVVVVVVKFIVPVPPRSRSHIAFFPSRIYASHFSPPSTVNAIFVIEDDCDDDDDAVSEDESCAFTRGAQSSSDRRNIQ
jgi:hypothetical protein